MLVKEHFNICKNTLGSRSIMTFLKVVNYKFVASSVEEEAIAW